MLWTWRKYFGSAINHPNLIVIALMLNSYRMSSSKAHPLPPWCQQTKKKTDQTRVKFFLDCFIKCLMKLTMIHYLIFHSVNVFELLLNFLLLKIPFKLPYFPHVSVIDSFTNQTDRFVNLSSCYENLIDHFDHSVSGPIHSLLLVSIVTFEWSESPLWIVLLTFNFYLRIR